LNNDLTIRIDPLQAKPPHFAVACHVQQQIHMFDHLSPTVNTERRQKLRRSHRILRRLAADYIVTFL
jgi:hypothetical protein